MQMHTSSDIVSAIAVLLWIVRLTSAANTECESLQRPSFPHCNPIKFFGHPEDGPVTEVLLNFNRPDNIRQIVEAMVNYKSVGEILVVSNNPNSSFTYVLPIVVVMSLIGYEESLGVAVRFKACLLAMHWHILIADDDLVVTELGLANMLKARHEHPWSIVGLWGRDYNHSDPDYQYVESGPGYHDIALTKALLLDTCACRAFWQASHLMTDIAHEASVTWNGEEIFMSLISTKVLGQQPYIMPHTDGVDKKELSEGKVGISSGQSHLPHRIKFLKTAIRRLQCFES